MTTSATARHRASVRPVTPLSSLTTAVTGQIGVIGRGGVVVAMSSGLVATTGLPAAQAAEQAAPAPEPATPPLVAPAPEPVGAAFQTALLPSISNEEATRLLEATNSVTAPLAADVAFETGAFKALPAPKPKAKAAPPSRRSARAADKATAKSPVKAAAKTAVKTAAERAAQQTAARRAAARQVAARQAAARQAAVQEAKQAAKAAAKARAKQAQRAKAKAQKSPSRSTSSSSTRGSSVLAVAARYVGVPYRYGGTTPNGWDCSGSVRYIYRQLGVSLPRTAHQQMLATNRISRSSAKPGDLVFFVSSGRAFHMGLYAGNGMMYDAGRTGRSFSKRKIWSQAVVYGRV